MDERKDEIGNELRRCDLRASLVYTRDKTRQERQGSVVGSCFEAHKGTFRI